MSLNVVFACVTEPKRELLEQSARLVMSLRWFGGAVANARIVVGATAPLPQHATALFEHFGAEVVRMAPYRIDHGPSNKVVLLGSHELADSDVVVIMDCDTIVVRDPSPWLEPVGLRAKVADLPTATLDELRGVFAHCGEPMPATRFTHVLTGDRTIAYCNSGVLVVGQAHRAELAERWDHYNRAVLQAPETVRFHRYHSDQISLALAIERSSVPFRELPDALNVPAHLPSYPDAWQDLDPVVIHYHWLAHPTGLLKTTPLAQCNRRIAAFNARLRAEGVLSSGPVSEVTRAAPSGILGGAAASAPIEATTNAKIVVGSGWWCDGTRSDWALGSDVTRAPAFFPLWHRQVARCLRPTRIVVTDSASPLKPDYEAFPDVEWIELDRNYGHANDIRVGRIKTKYSGFTRSVLLGAMVALGCDADYYVYVEQDCLLVGDDLLAHAIGDSTEDILIGARAENAKGIDGKPAAPMLQQSLMIVRRSALERFLEGLLGSPWSDGEKSPEEIMRERLVPFGLLRIPYGRSRPIDYGRSHFYAQHLEREELDRLVERIGARAPAVDFAFDVSR